MRKPDLPVNQAHSNPSAAKPAGQSPSWQTRRDWLRSRLESPASKGISAEETEAHFSGMPARYWEQVTEADLLWSLQAVQGFLKVVAGSDAPATKPVMDWRPAGDSASTRVMLCTWDRHGLLAKAAAAFSAVRLNILQAEAFTRADNIVLDFFSVTDLDGGGAVGEARLRETLFLLEGALSEPPRFVSVWMSSRHKYLLPPGQPLPQITFDNQSSPAATLVRIDAPDRLGLLCDILQTLADSGLDITEANIQTENKLARDVVHVRDANHQKVVAPARLKALRQKLEASLALKDQPGGA
jgi:[protein-PII] uridylyltransferase